MELCQCPIKGVWMVVGRNNVAYAKVHIVNEKKRDVDVPISAPLSARQKSTQSHSLVNAGS
jgi:hypothetical protein